MFSIFAWILPFFPLVIFLDYPKKKDLNVAVTYLLCFYGIGALLAFFAFNMGLLTIPIVLAAIVLLVLARWSRFSKK